MSPRILLAAIGVATATPAGAQVLPEKQQATPTERFDIRIDPPSDEAPLEDCSAEQQAATISGEIVVCRRRAATAEFGYDSERASERYARETMDAGDLRPPNVEGPGIFQGPATVGGLCGIGFNPCPPPPAYFIDFNTLPDAPPGSDADRIARGLPPLGQDASAAGAQRRAEEQRLGLPPANGASDPGVSRAEAASPAAEPSG